MNISEFCARRLGAHVTAHEFSDGTVHGVLLEDGRRVVIKIHRADADVEFLAAVQRTQTAIADAGMPAPRPLLPPTPIADGVAMVEELLDAGAPTPAHDAEQRRRMAADLHRFVVLATRRRDAFGGRTGLFTAEGDSLYPPPHDRRFDFGLPGGEWIDRLAAPARATLRSWRGPVVVGHSDWRVENLRYDAGALSAIYDWDSLVVRPEAALVGGVAGIFTVDWRRIDRCRFPVPEETAAFLAAYERARGRPFSAGEHDLARAGLVYQTAYNARCEWSDLGAPASLPPVGSLARLADLR